MVEKIGKLLLFLLVSTHVLCGKPAFQLDVVDLQGAPLKQAEEGTPFVVRLTMKDAKHVQPPHFLPGFEDCKVQGSQTSTRVSIVQGKRSQETIVSYTVRCDEKKKLVFGPFVYNKIFSNIVELQVRDREITKQQKKKNPELFLQWEAPKTSFYVGEKIPLELVVYQRKDGSPRELQLSDVQVGGLKVDWQEDPDKNTNTQVQKYGEPYIRTSMALHVHADKPGTYPLRSVRGVYVSTEQDQKGVFGHSLLAMWHAGRMQRQVQSNSLRLTVKSLPQENQASENQLIGSVSNVKLVSNVQNIEVGKACSVELHVEGDFNVYTAPDMSLQHMPKGCMVYQSNRRKTDKGIMYEYVLQPQKAGTLTVPQQVISYFDTTTGTYKARKTNDLVFEVIAGQQPEQQQHSEDVVHKDEQNTGQEHKKQQAKLEEPTVAAWHAQLETKQAPQEKKECRVGWFFLWFSFIALSGLLIVLLRYAFCAKIMKPWLWRLYFWGWGFVFLLVTKVASRPSERVRLFRQFLEHFLQKYKPHARGYLPELVAQSLHFSRSEHQAFLAWYNSITQKDYAQNVQHDTSKQTVLYWFNIIKERVWQAL